MSVRKIARAFGLKKLTAAFNFTTTVRLNNTTLNVPVLRNLGIENTKVKEDFIFKIFKAAHLDGNACFVDIGVNVGQTLLKFRSCSNNPYYGFEPNPSCVHYLHTLISLNKMADTTIVPVGLSSSSTVAKFYQKSEADTAGTMINDLRPDYYAQDEVNYVPVFPLDSLDITDGRKIGLIKIDVEGAESEVLAGMTATVKKHQAPIICEVLDCHTEENVNIMQPRANKLVGIVKAMDYDLYHLDHSHNDITYKQVQEIVLKKWTPASEYLNDYIFLPKGVAFESVFKL